MFSGRRGAALIAVIILHIFLGWALYSGLAGNLMKKIIPPVEIVQIDKPKEIDKPPPPPPKLEDIKPFVPPPEEHRYPDDAGGSGPGCGAGGARATGTEGQYEHQDGSETSAEDRRGLLPRRFEARQ